ncbi:hypothetical protein SAMN02927937_02880, partial [Paenimyroides aquimaris]
MVSSFFHILVLRQIKNMSNKDTEKKLVGQPIFKQIINFIPKDKFDMLVYKH